MSMPRNLRQWFRESQRLNPHLSNLWIKLAEIFKQFHTAVSWIRQLLTSQTRSYRMGRGKRWRAKSNQFKSISGTNSIQIWTWLILTVMDTRPLEWSILRKRTLSILGRCILSKVRCRDKSSWPVATTSTSPSAQRSKLCPKLIDLRYLRARSNPSWPSLTDKRTKFLSIKPFWGKATELKLTEVLPRTLTLWEAPAASGALRDLAWGSMRGVVS